MKKLYIAGPMTGLPELNYPAFAEAASVLRSHGYEVVSPAELNPQDRGWEESMRIDLAKMLSCDGIATLANWKKSRGARLECFVAMEVGMKVAPIDFYLATLATLRVKGAS